MDGLRTAPRDRPRDCPRTGPRIGLWIDLWIVLDRHRIRLWTHPMDPPKEKPMGEAYGAAYGLVYRTMDVKKVLCCSISCRARGRRSMESTRLSDGTIAPDQQIYHINSSHRISANSPRAATRIRAPSDFGQEQRSEQKHQLGHEHQSGKTDNLQRADNKRSEVARCSLQRSQYKAHRSPVLLRIDRPHYVTPCMGQHTSTTVSLEYAYSNDQAMPTRPPGGA